MRKKHIRSKSIGFILKEVAPLYIPAIWLSSISEVICLKKFHLCNMTTIEMRQFVGNPKTHDKRVLARVFLIHKNKVTKTILCQSSYSAALWNSRMSDYQYPLVEACFKY